MQKQSKKQFSHAADSKDRYVMHAWLDCYDIYKKKKPNLDKRREKIYTNEAFEKGGNIAFL